MQIRFIRGSGGKDTLACQREDGTTTWSRVPDRFLLHDIAHYVVESTLGYSDAFFGMVSSGWDIDAFTARDAQSGGFPNLPIHAMQVEVIVIQVQSAWLSGARAEDVAELMRLSADGSGIVPPELDYSTIETILDRLTDCYKIWESVPSGGELSAEFPSADPVAGMRFEVGPSR